MKTTLNKIREHSPCKEGWEKLLRHLGKSKADDEPLMLLTILDSNGLDDAMWCLRAVDGYDREMRLFAVWCARQVQHLMQDERSSASLDVAERFALGAATADELTAAWAAAWYAARDAANAAWYAASAASAAAEDAASAAWDAARAAASAAWAAASAAASAAWDAARDAQEAEFRRILNHIGEQK